ncbi:MAG: 50S ribosomal protein L22 [Caldisericia bacterium]|nr:50S ribosomal protein L22 [Caldisericia bacterium]
MEAYAKLKFTRLSPFKARKVAALIRNKDVGVAEGILGSMPHKAARILFNTLKSAVANAKENYLMNEDLLTVSRVLVDAAKPMRRFKPRAMGRADVMYHRTSHITIYVREKEN